MKKAVSTILSLIVVLLVSTISVTFAWFLGATELFVDNIKLTVDASADIYISLDDNFENAKHSLSVEDFGEIGDFLPVSSMGSEHSDWINNPEITEPTFKSSYLYSYMKNPPVIIAKRGYFSKRIYLFSDKRMYATFDSVNTYIRPDIEQNTKVARTRAQEIPEDIYMKIARDRIAWDNITDSKEQQEYIEQARLEQVEYYTNLYLSQLNSIENSLRVSILDRDTVNDNPYTIIDLKKNGNTVFGGRLNTSATSKYYDYYADYETNTYREILFGDIKTQDHELQYLPAKNYDTEIEGRESCFNACTKAGICGLDMEDLATNVTFYEEQSITGEEADVTVSLDETRGYMIELIPGVPHPINLSVYIEGWDLDNTNLSREASFEISIKFRLIREAFAYE